MMMGQGLCAVLGFKEMIMRKLFFGVVVALSIAGCDRTCESGAICGDYNNVGPSSLPSPTPVPLPGATPDPCRIESVQVGFHSGAQFPFLALGETHQIDATPFNSSGQVPDGCNVNRSVTWGVLTPITCQVIGSGYNPFLRGLRVGSCSVTATVASVVSAPFSVEVR
jgi:hypothetical protein